MWNEVSAFVTVSLTIEAVVNSTTPAYSRVEFRNDTASFHDEE